MQSICWTTRLVTRALRNGFSTLVEPNSKVKPHFVSVACGFPKDFQRSKPKLGRFGEDAWFISSTQNSDVIGELQFFFFISNASFCAIANAIESSSFGGWIWLLYAILISQCFRVWIFLCVYNCVKCIENEMRTYKKGVIYDCVFCMLFVGTIFVIGSYSIQNSGWHSQSIWF